MTGEIHILEQPDTLYAMARAIQALAGLETLIDPHKAALGSFASHVAAVRQMLEEDFDNGTTAAEKEMIADRLDQEADTIITHLCEFPCPEQEIAMTSSTSGLTCTEATVRVRYDRMPLPAGIPWMMIVAPTIEIDGALVIIEAAIRAQNPGIAEVDVRNLALECLQEDYRVGMRPVPPHSAAGAPALETAAE